jgi:UDP-N-acetylmuramoyl-tripeptide--D-alanyl-D-alanine ligase
MQHAAQAYGAARHFADVPQLIAALGEQPDAACVLVKGSRFMKMERVVEALMAPAADDSSKQAPGAAGTGATPC